MSTALNNKKRHRYWGRSAWCACRCAPDNLLDRPGVPCCVSWLTLHFCRGRRAFHKEPSVHWPPRFQSHPVPVVQITLQAPLVSLYQLLLMACRVDRITQKPTDLQVFDDTILDLLISGKEKLGVSVWSLSVCHHTGWELFYSPAHSFVQIKPEKAETRV